MVISEQNQQTVTLASEYWLLQVGFEHWYSLPLEHTPLISLFPISSFLCCHIDSPCDSEALNWKIYCALTIKWTKWLTVVHSRSVTLVPQID